jgi:hypothetical protein
VGGGVGLSVDAIELGGEASVPSLEDSLRLGVSETGAYWIPGVIPAGVLAGSLGGGGTKGMYS